MFWKGGHLYVYFTYGMHFCANVVTADEGTGEAVLIRALEPVRGIEIMERNRRLRAKRSALRTGLTNGPAKLCEALSIRREQNGADLLGGDVYIVHAPSLPSSAIGRSTRIGITHGKEKKWRFTIKGNVWVSR
jgi:DNA-3-methyladenine glycosylase